MQLRNGLKMAFMLEKTLSDIRVSSEDRLFWNIVFARSKDELDRKLVELKSVSPQTNYNKFSETLAPMIYWGGDNVYDVIATEDIE